MSLDQRPLSQTIVRNAIPADVPAILEMEHLSFEHAGERFGERHIRYLIESRRAIVIVAEVDGRILGWAAGFAWTRGKIPWGRVYSLAVHPASRGRRLGPLLLTELIDALTQRGAARTFLEVRPDNHTAIRLYEKFGFTTCRTMKDYYGPGRPAQRMERRC